MGRLLTLGVVLALLLPAGSRAFGDDKGAKDEPFHLKKRETEVFAQVSAFERMLERRGFVGTDVELQDYVASVGQHVVPADFADDRLLFRFRVMRSPQANAFALPNGSIYVTLGLISLLENEGQLAAVLAHEVTHASRYHYFRFDRQYKAKSVALNLFSGAAPWVGGWTGLLAGLGAQALYIGTIFGYSRDLEEEADRMGLTALGAAGYDVGQMPASFRRLLVDYEGLHMDTPAFYSSHPKLSARIEYTEEQIQKDHLVADSGRAFPDRYALPREQAAREEVRLAIVNDLQRTAIATADFLVGRRPDSAEAHHLCAEGYRALGYRSRDVTSNPPSNTEKKRLLREKLTRTPEELEIALAESDAGRAAWAANAATAEQDYRKALELDAHFFEAHLGLALLFEKMGRYAEALDSAEAYLRLAPEETLQRVRAVRLADDLRRPLGQDPRAVVP